MLKIKVKLRKYDVLTKCACVNGNRFEHLYAIARLITNIKTFDKEMSEKDIFKEVKEILKEMESEEE